METHKMDNYVGPQTRKGSGKMVVGAKQLRKALLKGTAKQVFLARNADPALTEPLEAMCRERNIRYAWVPSMVELGKQCGIEVGAAAAAVVD